MHQLGLVPQTREHGTTSSTMNSRIAVRFAPGSARPSAKAATVSAPPIARLAAGVTVWANCGASHSADRPVTIS